MIPKRRNSMEKTQVERKSNYERVYSFVNNAWVILFCNICTVAGIVLTCVIDNLICRIIFCSLASIFALFVAFYLFYRVFGIRRAKRNVESIRVAKERKLFEYIHQFHHNLRDYLNFLSNEEKLSRSAFIDKASLLCNQLEQIFTIALGAEERVSVCFKCIKSKSILNENNDEWELYTLARSVSTRSERLKYDRQDRIPDTIVNNTDFRVIVSDEEKYKEFNCFSCGDLDSYAEEFLLRYKTEFKNSHENPPYKSVIVVPIRIKSDSVSKIIKESINKKNYYNVIGFLCIDSEEKFIDSPKDFKFSTFNNCVQLACALGDSLYCFFESYFVNDILS